MNTASEIIEAVGRERIKAEFGVKTRVVNAHAATGTLPAAWFDALERMAGQQLPRRLFSFKGRGE